MNAGNWLKLVRNSVLAAALATAAQVGIGSGVGIIDWQPGLAGPAGWRALLTWVVFMFAVGVIAGALAGRRFLPIRLRPARPFVRATAAVAAGFGSLLAVPVVWLPVAVAHSSVSPRPQLAVAIAAGVGVALGVAASLFALVWGAVATGAGLTVAWVWLLALISAGLSAMKNAAVTPGLGLLDAPAAIPPSTWWSGPFLMVGLAAGLGLAVAAVAGWRGATWPGVALSGVVGPGLIAAAYLTTGWALASAGLTTASGAAAPVVAALVAATVGLIVSAAVAAPQQRRHRYDSFGGTPNPGATLLRPPGRPRAIEARRPLAITSTPESPYVMESSDPIYVAPPRASYSADPYSSGAFEVSSRAFDTISLPAPSRPSSSSPSPSTPPAPPVPSRPAPKSPGPAVPPSSARPPAPGFAPPTASSGAPRAPSAPVSSASDPVSPARPAQPVSAFPGGSDASGLFPPVSSPPVPAAPTRGSYVEPSRLAQDGYAKPAGPSEPGFDERVYRMPAPGSSARPKPLKNDPKPAKSKGRAATPAPSAPATPAAAPVTGEPTLRVPTQPPPAPPTRSPVADPAPPARPAPAAGPVPAQPTTRRGRKAARAAAAAAAAKPVPEPSSLRAGSIEGEVLSESTSPTSGAPTGRRGRAKDRPLRKGEREHIDWVTNLVQIEHDAVLKTSKDR